MKCQEALQNPQTHLQSRLSSKEMSELPEYLNYMTPRMKADNQKSPPVLQSGCLRLGLVIFFCSLTQLHALLPRSGFILRLSFTAEDGSSRDSRITRPFHVVTCYMRLALLHVVQP
jgi:hypothetical protein